MLQLIRQVLTPGAPAFRAQLARNQSEHARLLNCLHLLDEPVISEVRAASEEAASLAVGSRANVN